MNSDFDFENFKDDCLDTVSVLQDGFTKRFDLNRYEHWSFDDDFGVFHFESDKGQSLYFNYSLVGSFSDKTSTWKWSWDNEHLKQSERKNIERVKTFGEENKILKISTGLIDGDEYTGWEMTAVAAKILNAIGVYRFKQDYLTYFIVFTGELTEGEYAAWKEEYVACATHGASRAAFVCQHLNRETYTGFHEAFESNPLIEPDDDYQAWCNACEEVRLREGEWNDVSEGYAKIKLVCGHCFFEIKARNLVNPQ